MDFNPLYKKKSRVHTETSNRKADGRGKANALTAELTHKGASSPNWSLCVLAVTPGDGTPSVTCMSSTHRSGRCCQGRGPSREPPCENQQPLTRPPVGAPWFLPQGHGCPLGTQIPDKNSVSWKEDRLRPVPGGPGQGRN